MTEVYINNAWIQVDDVKIKRQISDIGQFVTKCNISEQFAIPKTKENRQTFEWLDDIKSNSTLPYIELDSKLKIDGNVVISSGKALIEKSGNNFEIIIRDGNIDFFRAIEGKTLTDLDLSDYDFTWDLDYFKDNRDADDKPIFLNYSFGLGILDVAHMLPFIPISLIVDKIISEAGYTKSGDFFSDNLYTQLLISLVDRLPSPDTQQTLIAKAENCVTWTLTTSDQLSKNIEFADDDAPFDTVADTLGNRTRYNIYYDGNYDFEIKVKINTDYADSKIDKVTIYYGDSFDTEFFPTGSGDQTITKSYTDVALSAGESIYVVVTRQATNEIDLLEAYIDVTGVPDVKFAAYGAEYEISNNLPEMLQSDLIKMVLSLFCARIDCDGGYVYFRSYSDLKTKIKQGDFIDWSEKDLSNIQVSYKSDYAKKNQIKYSNTDIKKGEFEIDDNQLKDIRVLYTLPCEDKENIKAFKKVTDSEDNDTFEFSRLDRPVLKKRILSNGTYIMYNGTNISETETITNNLPIAESIDLQDYVDEYYDFLENTLSMYRKVTADIYLNINDINKLDFSKPYYIKKYGWFMLNNVIFRKGQRAKVEMVHINKSSFVPNLLGDYDKRDYNALDYNLDG